jgi:hypothetical protein
MANRDRVYRRVQRLNGSTARWWRSDIGPGGKSFVKKLFSHWERHSAPYHIREALVDMEENRRLDELEAAAAAYWTEREWEDYWEAVA